MDVPVAAAAVAAGTWRSASMVRHGGGGQVQPPRAVGSAATIEGAAACLPDHPKEAARPDPIRTLAPRRRLLCRRCDLLSRHLASPARLQHRLPHLLAATAGGDEQRVYPFPVHPVVWKKAPRCHHPLRDPLGMRGGSQRLPTRSDRHPPRSVLRRQVQHLQWGRLAIPQRWRPPKRNCSKAAVSMVTALPVMWPHLARHLARGPAAVKPQHLHQHRHRQRHRRCHRQDVQVTTACAVL